MNKILNDYKELIEFKGKLNYITIAGQTNEEVYELSGYIDYLIKLCNKYNINFNKEKIDWEWCNYITGKSYELEKKLENLLFKR